MFTEPGYYEDGKFGIRIENIVKIVKAETKHNFRDRGFLTFKTVTLVPIQTKLIDPTLLTENEVRHLTLLYNYLLSNVSPGQFFLILEKGQEYNVFVLTSVREIHKYMPIIFVTVSLECKNL